MFSVPRSTDKVVCSFCLKGPEQVRKLVIGPGEVPEG